MHTPTPLTFTRFSLRGISPRVHVILDAKLKAGIAMDFIRRVLHLPRLRVSRVERARDDAAFTCIMQKRMETRTSPMHHSIYGPRAILRHESNSTWNILDKQNQVCQ